MASDAIHIALAKQLEQAKIAATRPPGAMTATDHSKRMSELEAARHAMIKNITSAEDALSEREATLKALNDEERKLRSTDVAAEHQLDSTTLKLELIRGMGFEPVWTKDGSLSKIIVRESGVSCWRCCICSAFFHRITRL